MSNDTLLVKTPKKAFDQGQGGTEFEEQIRFASLHRVAIETKVYSINDFHLKDHNQQTRCVDIPICVPLQVSCKPTDFTSPEPQIAILDCNRFSSEIGAIWTRWKMLLKHQPRWISCLRQKLLPNNCLAINLGQGNKGLLERDQIAVCLLVKHFKC